MTFTCLMHTHALHPHLMSFQLISSHFISTHFISVISPMQSHADAASASHEFPMTLSLTNLSFTHANFMKNKWCFMFCWSLIPHFSHFFPTKQSADWAHWPIGCTNADTTSAHVHQPLWTNQLYCFGCISCNPMKHIIVLIAALKCFLIFYLRPSGPDNLDGVQISSQPFLGWAGMKGYEMKSSSFALLTHLMIWWSPKIPKFGIKKMLFPY